MKSAQQIIDASISEAQFRAMVLELAERTGWLCYYVRDSRMVTCRGFYDLVLLHPVKHRMLLRELKTAKGRLRPEQQVWLEGAIACGLDAGIWRPQDWEEIVAILST